MTPTDHLKWEPQPHGVYYAHIGMAPEGDALGMVLVRVESGRKPCNGNDSDPDDDYVGDVHCSAQGAPLGGQTVQYAPLAHILQPDPKAAPPAIPGIKTDSRGRHVIWLQPGLYGYRYVNEAGSASAWQEIEVAKGHEVEWESVVAVPEGETESGSDDAEPETVTRRREIAFVCQDLVLDWHREDGKDFSLHEAEDTIAHICKRVRGLRQVSFARPTVPSLMIGLQRRGLPVVDTMWRDMELAAAGRNFNALVKARSIKLVPHPRMILQIRRIRVENRRLVPSPGIPYYLAEGAFASAHFAIQTAAAEAPRVGFPMRNMSEVLKPDETRGRGLDECLGELFGRAFVESQRQDNFFG